MEHNECKSQCHNQPRDDTHKEITKYIRVYLKFPYTVEKSFKTIFSYEFPVRATRENYNQSNRLFDI